VGRTASAAGTFSAFRTGEDRLRNAARRITEGLEGALPFRGRLVARRAGLALIDKGRMDKVAEKTVYEIVASGAARPLSEGIGLSYTRDDVVGTITVDEVDEQLSMGSLVRVGFFDRIAAGDEVVAVPENAAAETKPAKAENVVADLNFAGCSGICADKQRR
jgi:hypothetical protein